MVGRPYRGMVVEVADHWRPLDAVEDAAGRALGVLRIEREYDRIRGYERR